MFRKFRTIFVEKKYLGVSCPKIFRSFKFRMKEQKKIIVKKKNVKIAFLSPACKLQANVSKILNIFRQICTPGRFTKKNRGYNRTSGKKSKKKFQRPPGSHKKFTNFVPFFRIFFLVFCPGNIFCKILKSFEFRTKRS